MNGDNSVENKINEIVTKLKTDDSISKDQKDMINNLIGMIPELELKNKTSDYNKKQNKIDYKSAQMVFDVIEYNGKQYYLNESNGIWDDDAELVGSLIGYDSDGKPIITFFNENIISKVPKYIKKNLDNK